MNDYGEDNRLMQCTVCRCRVKKTALYTVGKLVNICEGCGRDEIQKWNTFVRGVSDGCNNG